MSNHTPGPWEVIEAEDGGGYTIQNPTPDHESSTLLYDPIVWEMGGIDTEANARLIAAAPDLLAACEAFYTQVESLVLLSEKHNLSPMVKATFEKCLDMASAAIAKARA